MDDRSSPLDRSAEDRCHEPAAGRRSVAMESALHAGVLEDSEQPRSEGEPTTPPQSHAVLGDGDPANATEPQRQREATIPNADVGALGRTAGERFVPVQEAKHALNRLRPSELTRLLNSTPLGTVITESKLYRQREVAGHRIGEHRWIDLVRYTAWLFLERHEPQPARRRRVKGKTENDKITKSGVLRLLERQKYRCCLTGWELTPHNASLDHRQPVSRGGTHTLSNAQALHEDVNRAKGTLTNEEFIELCRAVVRHADQQQLPQPSTKETP